MKTSLGPNTCREMLAILLLALVLGAAYNRSSPLGISVATSGTPAPAIALAASKVTPPVPTAADIDPALHNETMTAVIVSSGPGVSLSPVHQQPSSMAWAEIKPLLASGGIVLVDGRDTVSYEAGHIPGAISLPLPMLAEKMAQFSNQYPKNKMLAVYCASIRCPVSHAEAIALREQYGYQDVREMPGGFAEWRVAEPTAAPTQGAAP